MATKTKSRSKTLSTVRPARMKKADVSHSQMNVGILIGLIIALVALVLTYLLSSELMTSQSDAIVKLQCSMSCTKSSQCASGLICAKNNLGKNVCTCGQGVCSAQRCVLPYYGTGEEGAECDKTLTDRGLAGTPIPATAINRVCRQGAQCRYVARNQGSGFKCCTPGSANPNCTGNVPSGIQGRP